MNFTADLALLMVFFAAFLCGSATTSAVWSFTLWSDRYPLAGKVAACMLVLAVTAGFIAAYFARLVLP